MPRGVVKWFDETKRYGFIAQEGGPDVFVHRSAVQDPGFPALTEGQEVEFEVEKDEKGRLRAKNVRKL